MAPKRPQINPFSMYLREQEPLLRRRGLIFNSKQQVVEYLFPHFNALSDVERQKYKNMAQEEKQQLRGDLTRKFDDRGVPLAHIVSEQQERRKQALTMQTDIIELVEGRDGGLDSLLNVKFYTMNASLHCQTDESSETVYIPAEMSISEWTLADGVLRSCSFIVNTDEIPCGYKSRCRDISDATHRLPLDFEGGERHLPSLWIRLREFVNPQQRRERQPPVFVRNADLPALTGCLRWMHERARDSRASPWRVYSLSSLLYELLTAAGEPQLSSFCSDQLDTGTYDFVNELACQHHSQEDNAKHCARAMSQRQAFIVLDMVAPKFGVQPRGGQHMPIRQPVAASVRKSAPLSGPSSDGQVKPLPFRPARNTQPNLPTKYTLIEPAGGSQFAGVGWDVDERAASRQARQRRQQQPQQQQQQQVVSKLNERPVEGAAALTDMTQRTGALSVGNDDARDVSWPSLSSHAPGRRPGPPSSMRSVTSRGGHQSQPLGRGRQIGGRVV